MATMKTPGVYIVEKNAFPNSIVQVETAIPAFIGYTEKAINKRDPLHMKPFRLSSMAEFHEHFGAEPDLEFSIQSDEDEDTTLPPIKVESDGKKIYLKPEGPSFALYGAMRLFFQNGGGTCFIVSIGDYSADAFDSNAMVDGLKALKKEPEVTMVVIPETTRLPEKEAISVQQAMLKHCGYDMRNRFAILDMFKGHLELNDPYEPIKKFRNKLGINQLNFGAAYYPWVETTVFQSRDFTFENIQRRDHLKFISILRKSLEGDDTDDVKLIQAPQLPEHLSRSVIAGESLDLLPSDFGLTDEEVEEINDAVTESSWKVTLENGKLLKGNNEVDTITDKDLAGNELKFQATDNPTGLGEIKLESKSKSGSKPQTISVAINSKVAAKMEKFNIKDEIQKALRVNEPVKIKNASIAIAEGDLEAKQAGRLLGVWAIDKAEGEVTFTPMADFHGDVSARFTVKGEDGKDIEGLKNSQVEISADIAATPKIAGIDTALRAISPLYVDVMDAIAQHVNSMPPGAAMAGLYTMIDNTRGVWKAPANVSVNSVARPLVNISHEDQMDLNVTPQGKSINAIRPFIGEGTLVWGARTLDGNSLDWRYINVRRTMIMIEESVKLAAKAYVFEPNTANTWVTMRSMIENFLTSIWKQGGLAGAVPEDAFSVHVGLGETMTPVDILEGILRISVLLAVTRPAEFIEITFQQQMQKS